MIQTLPKLKKGPLEDKVLIEPNGHGLKLSVTDLEIFYSINIPGKINLPVMLKLSALKKLAKGIDMLDIERAEDTYSTVIRSEDSRYTLSGSCPEDFPEAPEPCVDALKTRVVAEDLLRAIKTTKGFICKDVTKEQLQVLVLQNTGGEMRVETTTARSLTQDSIPSEGDWLNILLPASAVKPLETLLKNSNMVLIEFANKTLRVQGEEGEAFFRLSAYDNWPNFDELIPKKGDALTLIEKIPANVLSKLIEKSSLLGNESSISKFTIKGKSIEVRSTSGEYDLEQPTGCTSFEQEIATAGETDTGWFLSRNLVKLLKPLGERSVTIYFTENKSVVTSDKFKGLSMRVKVKGS